MAPKGPTHVIRFPRSCPKCGALAASPSKAGTLTERRTQVHLKCACCRHEWSLEMAPPVLMFKPDRETDDEVATEQPPMPPQSEAGERRGTVPPKMRRMRVGLRGLLRSGDRAHTIAVLYSLDADGLTGRLRPMDPNSAWPPWLAEASRVWLSGDDEPPLRARISLVKAPAATGNDDDYFAEFQVHK